MVTPATYTNSTYNISETATDAKTILDYNGVVSACDKILSTANEGMKKIADNISNVQLGERTLCIEDKSLQPLVDELKNVIKGFPGQGIEPVLEEIKSAAQSRLDEIQTEKNDEARERFDKRVQQAAAAAASAASSSSN